MCVLPAGGKEKKTYRLYELIEEMRLQMILLLYFFSFFYSSCLSSPTTTSYDLPLARANILKLFYDTVLYLPYFILFSFNTLPYDACLSQYACDHSQKVTTDYEKKKEK